MFTGLIEAVCIVKAVRTSGDSVELTVDLGELAKEAASGNSIAVNGVCLTVSKLDGGSASFDVSSETLAKSALGELKASSAVNIERAMKPTDRLGGHIVQGHTDGTAKIEAIERRGRFANIKFAAESALLDNMIIKGSVAVDGISLTVAGMDQRSFSVAIIPKTLEQTTLGRAKIGDRVNIETDIIVKTIKKQLDKLVAEKGSLTIEKLKELGF